MLFARYAYPPNALGYCGPADPAALLGTAGEGGDRRELRHLAAQFEGAWPYLQLIAASNGLADPLDRAVVEAYWVGNALLGHVRPADLHASLDARFRRRAGGRFGALAEAVPAGAIPQHNFHVFGVYPWLGLLRAGMEGAPLEVLDRCRIRWGRVEEVAGDWVTVSSRPLVFEGSRLRLGPPRPEPARCRIDDASLVGPLETGEIVSLHWDWVCDRLTDASQRWLRYCTRRNLGAVNATARPGPAAACGA
ncbi:MAG: hypothetical protein KGJ77_00445 [Acidobacteriota bacterium]|nr:hypothetical protein [Acidobacteriota bacterium]